MPKGRAESANYKSSQKAEVGVQATNHANDRGESANYKSYQKVEVSAQATNHAKRQRWECKLRIIPTGQRWVCKLQIIPTCRGESANYTSHQKAEVRVQTTYLAKRQR